MDNRPIGVFDSGFGGLTAVAALQALCPGEDIIYFGDSGRVPYGGRGISELRVMARQNIDFLRGFGVKAILAACGTVSSSVLDEFKDGDIPLFGVIRPGAAKAARVTSSGAVGVIATQATIRSGAYRHALSELRPGARIISVGCPKLVPLVETGRFSPEDEEVSAAVREYLTPVRDAGCDTLLLGCTHYSLLSRAITGFLGNVSLVSAADEAALAVSRELKAEGLLKDASGGGRVTYHTSGSAGEFKRVAELLFGGVLEGGVSYIPPMPLM